VTATFAFEHVFRAPDPATLFALYFDPTHGATQDAATGIAAREVLEVTDGETEYRRVCRVTPHRQLPAFMRPFFPRKLHYLEEAIWRRPADQIDIEIRPSILGGRAQISSVYRLETVGPGLVRRTYTGSVSVEVALVGGRIERGMLRDLERSLVSCAACTQDYLDRQHPAPPASPDQNLAGAYGTPRGR
jgi:hypothetical protein